MKKSIIAAVAICMSLIGCTTKTQESKNLVLYYSQTGTTQAVAEEIGRLTNADIERMDVEEPYNGDFGQTIARCQEEMSKGVLPTVKPLNVNLDDYDTIFLGYPIWFGTCANPMLALLENVDFSGKKIVPFCTFGSGGLNTSVTDIRKKEPNAEVLEGYGVRTARIAHMPKEIDYFLKKQGYIKGEIAEYPDFTEQKPVTDEEKAIFDAACGDYQFPLGTPVTVGSRPIENATEYKYIVASTDGNESTSIIYVILSNEEGAKPEFTQVVR